MSKIKVKIFFFFVLFLIPSLSLFAKIPQEANQAILLADYIAGDYQMAIAQDGGKIINDLEYQEMLDFADLIGGYLDKMNIPSDSPVKTEWSKLSDSIKQKKPVSEVSQIANNLKLQLIQKFQIPTAPKNSPNLEKGGELYAQLCATCHGIHGEANTPVALGLNPQPPSFLDPAILEKLSPFKAFNVITFGIKNTAMPSFATLSEEDRWAVASYIFLLREKNPQIDTGLTTSSLKKAQSLIKEAIVKVGQKKWDEALDLTVTAYLEGYESSEAFLKATGHGGLVQKTEESFLKLRELLRQKNPESFNEAQKLLTLLSESSRFTEEGSDLSSSFSFIATFTIIVREGLEAILLLAVIFSVLRLTKTPVLTKWAHFSWVLALVIGFLTWLMARKIISGVAREGLEGWMSLIASGVLVYVSYWLFAKRDVELWKKLLLGRLQNKKNIAVLTISSICFLAVYREAFETILFLEALRLQTSGGFLFFTLGVVSGFLCLLLIAWIILKLGRKIPLHLFFGFSGIFLSLLAIVFVGQGIHALQEAGIISYTRVSFITLPILGIHPTLETLVFQGGLLILFIISFYWQEFSQKAKRVSRIEKKVGDTSLELFNLHELGEHLLTHLSQLKEKLGSKKITDEEMKEIIGHMHDLDAGIHQVILHLSELREHVPQTIEDIYNEVQNIEGENTKNVLLQKTAELKKHLQKLHMKRG